MCEEKRRSAITSLRERPPTYPGQSGPVMNFGKHCIVRKRPPTVFCLPVTEYSGDP